MSPTQSTIQLTIIVVSYNTSAMTVACLDSIAAQTRLVSYEVIIVDNASIDDSVAALQHHPLGQHLIALSENVGFARANNLAAVSAQGEMILLLNPDTVVLDGAIDRLVEFALAYPQAQIWGGRTLFADGSLNLSSCWAKMSPWNLLCRATGLTGLFPRSLIFNGESYGDWQRDRIADVDIVSGCFLLLRRSLWLELGGFDPAFFVYGEEADLCLRAQGLGARPMITPEASIIHHGGASEATRIGKMTKLLAAKALLIRRHWQPNVQSLGLVLLAAWPLSRWVALAVIGRLTVDAHKLAAATTWREIWLQRQDWLFAYGKGSAVPAATEVLPSSIAR